MERYVVILYFNETGTDFLLVGPFLLYKDAEEEIIHCKTLYKNIARYGISILCPPEKKQ